MDEKLAVMISGILFAVFALTMLLRMFVSGTLAVVCTVLPIICIVLFVLIIVKANKDNKGEQ